MFYKQKSHPKVTFFVFYMPMHDVAPSAVTMAVAIDAII